jgi:mono/diheme cytochrome c family protein/predicted small lipoprotein YifL
MKREVRKFGTVLTVLAGLLALAGCGREIPFDKPPLHVDRGMSEQPKFKPQSENDFFADKASMRMPVPGTVSHDEFRDNSEYYFGKNAKGEFVAKTPISVTMQNLKRGQERFNIYCSPCHSRVGDGKGIMVSRGYPPPPTYHSDRLIKIQDGYIFDVISNGLQNMPSYRHQIPVADRWDIVLYVRALQRSENATINDIPEELREKIK